MGLKCRATTVAKNFIRGNATPLNDQFHFPNLTLKIDFFCCLDLLYEVGAWESVRGVAVDYLAGHGVSRCLRKGLSRARATFILGAKAEGWQLGESWRDAIASWYGENPAFGKGYGDCNHYTCEMWEFSKCIHVPRHLHFALTLAKHRLASIVL